MTIDLTEVSKVIHVELLQTKAFSEFLMPSLLFVFCFFCFFVSLEWDSCETADFSHEVWLNPPYEGVRRKDSSEFKTRLGL